MNILLLAPHPFYQERGTPIAVDLLVQTLCKQGHRVDILTYHEGSDRTYKGDVRIHRIQAPRFCHQIRPGFSLKKVRADIVMHREAMRLAAAHAYDCVHAVEESVFMAMRIRRTFGIPYIIDMDSSMPLQIAQSLPMLRFLLPTMQIFEKRAIQQATAVAVVCDALADIATAAGGTNVCLFRDVPLLEPTTSGTGFREELDTKGCVALYIGNLENYQGIDLMLDSFATLRPHDDVQLVVVGGIAKHIEQYQARAHELGIDSHVHFLGPRPIGDMAALMAEADILVSPRTKGNNTPMKIYSYMAAGKAILATDLATHTQVLDPEIACLAAPHPDAFAAGLRSLIDDADQRKQLGQRAQERVEQHYSLPVFENAVAQLYNQITPKDSAT